MAVDDARSDSSDDPANRSGDGVGGGSRDGRARDSGSSSVTAPDDARELDRDVAALHRERRAEQRRQRWTSALGRRRGLAPLLVGGVLAVVAVFGLLLVVLHPRFPEPAAARPLASPSTPAGQIGGLLPDGPVLTPGSRTTLRGLARPGVLVLVPTPCGCDGVVSTVVDQALQVTRSVRLLSTGRQDPTGVRVAALRTGPGRGLVLSAVDERGVLASRLAPVGVTVVLVGADGVVLDVVRDVQAGQRLDSSLARLQERG